MRHSAAFLHLGNTNSTLLGGHLDSEITYKKAPKNEKNTAPRDHKKVTCLPDESENKTEKGRLLDLSWVCAHGTTQNISTLRMSENGLESATGIDLGVTNKS